MKTIYLVRHAKASRDERGIKDWERPLTVAGVQRAQKVAKKLYIKKILPKRIASSHAFRALNTAIIFTTTMRIPVSSIEIYSSIYDKKASDIVNMLKKQDDSVESIMLFGHNPSISILCNDLTGKKNKELPTSAVACIEFKTTKWTEIGKFTGKLIFIETGN